MMTDCLVAENPCTIMLNKSMERASYASYACGYVFKQQWINNNNNNNMRLFIYRLMRSASS